MLSKIGYGLPTFQEIVCNGLNTSSTSNMPIMGRYWCLDITSLPNHRLLGHEVDRQTSFLMYSIIHGDTKKNGNFWNAYVEMLKSFVAPALNNFPQLHEAWFQQDGATSHTARQSMAAVRESFGNHVISRFGDIPWPPTSPDLSVCDFFLVGLP